MRFAWLQRKAANGGTVPQSAANQVTLAAYNLVWWIPIVLSVAKIIDYGTGFVAFAVVTAARLGANLYRNNVLTLEQAERFPFRAP
jgi:hypothetical protein